MDLFPLGDHSLNLRTLTDGPWDILGSWVGLIAFRVRVRVSVGVRVVEGPCKLNGSLAMSVLHVRV